MWHLWHLGSCDPLTPSPLQGLIYQTSCAINGMVLKSEFHWSLLFFFFCIIKLLRWNWLNYAEFKKKWWNFPLWWCQGCSQGKIVRRSGRGHVKPGTEMGGKPFYPTVQCDGDFLTCCFRNTRKAHSYQQLHLPQRYNTYPHMHGLNKCLNKCWWVDVKQTNRDRGTRNKHKE